MLRNCVASLRLFRNEWFHAKVDKDRDTLLTSDIPVLWPPGISHASTIEAGWLYYHKTDLLLSLSWHGKGLHIYIFMNFSTSLEYFNARPCLQSAENICLAASTKLPCAVGHGSSYSTFRHLDCWLPGRLQAART